VTTIEIREEVDRFVLHFDTPRQEINAYGLASALVGLSDAIREANAAVNPGYRVEVVVEALTDGSFRAVIRTVFEKAKNLFSHEAAKAIIYGIIATHIYERAIKREEPTRITVSDDSVVIEVGKNKIIVPKSVYEAKRQLEKSERFKSAIGQVFSGAASDPSVQGIAITATGGTPPEPFYIPREDFALLQTTTAIDETTREVVETAHLEISRAILERGKRKWEFFWRGIKIAAPILDERFFNRFFAHEVTIAPGDALEVALRIVQERRTDTGIYVNVRYEVIEVYNHVPRLKQQGF
jgi:hypothetical protein